MSLNIRLITCVDQSSFVPQDPVVVLQIPCPQCQKDSLPEGPTYTSPLPTSTATKVLWESSKGQNGP